MTTDDQREPDGEPEEVAEGAAPSPQPRPFIDPAVLRSITNQAEIARKFSEAYGAEIARMQRQAARVMAQSDAFTKMYADWRSHAALIARAYDVSAFRDAVAAMVPKVDPAWFAGIAQRVKEQLPANWGSSLAYEKLSEIALEDGIPVVWVPRAELLDEISNAPDRATRVTVLLSYAADVVSDCRGVLASVTHPDLAERVPLAADVLNAWSAGYHAAAQTLAVAVTEAILTEFVSAGRSYKVLSQDVQVDIAEITLAELRTTYALLPVAQFYTPWYPKDGTPPPDALSRHATVHHARADHLTEENALIALMLMTSILRSIQDERADDPDPNS